MARVFRSPASNWSCAVALGVLAVLTACGGGRSDTTLSPSPSGNVTVISGSTGGTGPSGATVTMTSAGVNPSTVTISVGQSVTFVNGDTRSHEIASDPHPIHGSCPSIERGLGTITSTTRIRTSTAPSGFSSRLQGVADYGRQAHVRVRGGWLVD